MPSAAEFVQRYKAQLDKQMGVKQGEGFAAIPITTKEYTEFKKQYMPKPLSIYEQLCNNSEKILKLKPEPKKEEEYAEAIRVTHLGVTPTGIASFALLGPAVFGLGGAILSLLGFNSAFLAMFFMASALGFYFVLNKLPFLIADSWRMKASNQMIICIFYIVTYMRHTSNLELAINFASDHLSPPLSLDLKKVLWDVETQTYPSLKESLELYLDSWKKYNLEFVEAMHLIEGSLLEGNEQRRVEMLDKSLSVILEETYEKMLHYVQDLRGPMTSLHMLGVILPILGLVILPLVVSFMQNAKWYYIALGYNVVLPIFVYYFGRSILSKRPSGYGDVDISENPDMAKLQKTINIGGVSIKASPKIMSFAIAIVFLIIGFSPIWIHLINPSLDFGLLVDPSTNQPKFQFLDYHPSKDNPNVIIGPFGIGATILSLFLPLSLGISVGLYNKLRSQNVIKVRENAKKLEAEFASALFQLGNRLADGLPAEIAFGKVAQTIEGTLSGKFFMEVSNNIKNLGMGVEQAIFDPKVGAIWKYPSNIIQSSMKVLVESARKGPLIAAQAMMNISSYIKEIHRVDERLKDLLSEIISSTKSQIKFMTPVISAIVIGITSMITTILGKLTTQMSSVSAGSGAVAGADISSMFGEGLPTFYFQFVVGFYVVEIIYILTVLNNTVENGTDKLNERYELGVNMIKSTILYCVLSGVVMFAFNMLAISILGGIGKS